MITEQQAHNLAMKMASKDYEDGLKDGMEIILFELLDYLYAPHIYPILNIRIVTNENKI